MHYRNSTLSNVTQGNKSTERQQNVRESGERKHVHGQEEEEDEEDEKGVEEEKEEEEGEGEREEESTCQRECLTCSRYDNVAFNFLITVHILPRAAILSALQRYKESPFLMKRR